MNGSAAILAPYKLGLVAALADGVTSVTLYNKLLSAHNRIGSIYTRKFYL